MQYTRLAVSLVAGLGIAGPLAAQNSLASGTRVRITAPALAFGPMTGTLVSETRDSLLVKFDAGDVRAIPTATLTEFQVRTGSHWEQGANIGAFLGASVGVAIASLSIHGESCASKAWVACAAFGTFDQIATDVPKLLAGSAAGFVLGAVAGGIIGSRMPTWGPAAGTHVAPQLTFERGRPALGLSVAF